MVFTGEKNGNWIAGDYYFKNQKAKENNKPTYFKYIESIRKGSGGGIVINGHVGSKVFFFYPVRNAITEYNRMSKEYDKNRKAYYEKYGTNKPSGWYF